MKLSHENLELIKNGLEMGDYEIVKHYENEMKEVLGVECYTVPYEVLEAYCEENGLEYILDYDDIKLHDYDRGVVYTENKNVYEIYFEDYQSGDCETTLFGILDLIEDEKLLKKYIKQNVNDEIYLPDELLEKLGYHKVFSKSINISSDFMRHQNVIKDDPKYNFWINVESASMFGGSYSIWTKSKYGERIINEKYLEWNEI